MTRRQISGAWLMPLVMVCSLLACRQETWESAMVAGKQAMQRGNYKVAERAFSAALIKADQFGSQDPRVALTLTFLAQAHQAQKNFDKAEALYGQALTIMQGAKGSEDPSVAAILNNLGVLHRLHGQYPDAEPYLTRALAIKEKIYGVDHLEVALTLHNLAQLYTAQGRYKKAEPAFKRALAIREKEYGSDHVDVTATRKGYHAMLRQAQRDQKAWK